MTLAAIMAEEVKPEPGAPIAKNAIDPELVKLGRTKLRIGMITCAVMMGLCAVFVLRLAPDRRFGQSGAKAEPVTAADLVAGKVEVDRFVSLEAEPLMSHAIRAVTKHGLDGLRVAPIRGTGERVWLVTSGDGNQQSAPHYVGRLRKLADLPFAAAVREYTTANPRPVFATPAAVRAGFQTGKVNTVSGEVAEVGAADLAAFDVVDPAMATIVAAYTETLPDAAAWTKRLTSAGLAPTEGPADANGARFTVSLPDAVRTASMLLEKSSSWAAYVEPVTRHYEITWSALAKSPAGGLAVEGATVPDAQLDLVGLYVARGVPDDAYAVLDGDRPDDYWYVLPISIGLGVVGLLFAWALVRAVRRDLLPPRA